MKTIGWLKGRRSDIEAARRARSVGLEVLPVSGFAVKQKSRSGLILGFVGCDQREIERGVHLLKAALLEP